VGYADALLARALPDGRHIRRSAEALGECFGLGVSYMVALRVIPTHIERRRIAKSAPIH
jgi:hypothetical protein